MVISTPDIPASSRYPTSISSAPTASFVARAAARVSPLCQPSKNAFATAATSDAVGVPVRVGSASTFGPWPPRRPSTNAYPL